ncbi:MAG: Glu-tRNA(Gln) amidotransferase subunit GatE [Candidatus Heimdallarchaeaceae archaeon]
MDVIKLLDPDSLTDEDFRNLGFHAGLEVHHQLRSKRKLFCHCPPLLEEDPEHMDYSFHRYFRPVLGEMGDYDEGMLVEYEKGYKVIYFANERNTCTYEMDETPPFMPDMDTIITGFVLAFYFDCSAFAEEVVVNRKQYLDGSITTGFQRTFIIARDGYVPVNGKKVRISNLHVEEDAARRVNWYDTAKRTVYFNLDRLGFPLAEIITDHKDVNTPQELVETALQIGRVLRISKLGRRGLGSVRQDVNISISGGDRVELKGVQDISKFDLYCRREVVRQHSLIEIKNLMIERGLKKEDFEHTYVDVSHLFDLPENTKMFASIFPKMNGLFGKEIQPGKDFGLDIFEKSMLITGIPREHHFHSDEIEENSVRKCSRYCSKLPIDQHKFNQIKSLLNAGEDDAFVVVMGTEKACLHALKKVVERVKLALDGVPQETRRVTPDGNSEFLRVIHGKDRIYPDTDTPPILIELDKLDEWRKRVGKRPWEVLAELEERFNFTQRQVDLLIRDEKIDLFYHFVDELKLDGNLAYNLLIETPRAKRRKGITLTDSMIKKIAEGLSAKVILRENIDQVIEVLQENPTMDVTSIRKLAVPEINESEFDQIINNVLNAFDRSLLKTDKVALTIALPKLVGRVIKEANNAVEGRTIAEKIKKILEVEN